MILDFTRQTKNLIDELKRVCADFGLGNDGNEFKIITQTFLYKFLNDKFGYELKRLDSQFQGKEPWDKLVQDLSEKEFEKYSERLPTNTARLNKEHLISYLYNNQTADNFADMFDRTLVEISDLNLGIFSITTASKAKITLFERVSPFISDPSKKDEFCRSLINRLVNFSFEKVFSEKFDFFSTIFEYLIKDYNKDGGGKYAEYYTPHAVSKIMAKILVDKPVANVTVYDPSAGSGTLLMNVANEIGEKNCTIFSQDISQKSSGMLRLNLILNDLVHSIPNVIQGNTLLEPAHRDKNGLKKFDYIVSNPPFKLDFSDFRDDLAEPQNSERFFAGIPKTLAKQKDKMAIYLLFLQHIITSLSAKGKSAIVVPNGFLTAGDSIERKIKELLISSNILTGVIAMPASIFANTTTKVSILFLDKNKKDDKVVFIDASNLGTLVKEGKNKRNVLSSVEEEKIIDTFVKQLSEEKFSEIVESKQVFKNSYSLNPGLYFKLTKKDYQIDPAEFENLKNETIKTIEHLFKDNAALQKSILSGLNGMRIKNEQ